MGRAIKSNKNFIKFESRSVWGEEKWNGEHWNYAEDGKAASTLQLRLTPCLVHTGNAIRSIHEIVSFEPRGLCK